MPGSTPNSIKNEKKKNGFALTWVTNYSTNELPNENQPLYSVQKNGYAAMNRRS